MLVKKIAILFSGAGSNLKKILEEVHAKNFSTCRIEVVCLICNKKDALGIEKAKKYGLRTIVVEHGDYKDRESFDRKMLEIIKKSGAELVVLAGFMRILTPLFTQNVKAINLHPSLLPFFKGANAIEKSYNSTTKEGGISVHYVNEELDSGEIIAQKSFKKEKDMSLDEFRKRIHDLEHELLPKTIIEILDKK